MTGLILMLAGLAALAGSWAVARSSPAGSHRRSLARRARALRVANQHPVAAQTASPVLRSAAGTPLDVLAQRLLPRPAVLHARLEATGAPITIGQYGAGCLAVAAVVCVWMTTLGAPLFAALFAGVGAGAWLPHVTVGVLMARRRGRFFRIFAEAIGLIVRGLRSGLPVTETIGVVGREMAEPVGEEFRRIADQVRLGEPLEVAMWRTARRLDLPEFNFLVISLSVQRETGGNLAETLENLEQILRRRQQMRLKIKAMSSEATASALIIGSLPFVMAGLMWMVSREYLEALFTTPLGQLMLAGAVTSLLVGAFVMRQMVRFEV